MEEIYYTYAYLRENKTPYYIGKGRRYRITEKSGRGFPPPTDSSRILILKKNLTEEEAFRHEIYMINVLGRKDLGTGILRNLTDGGEGTSGYRHTEESKQKMSESLRGEKHPMYGRTHSEKTIQKMSESKKNPSEETRRKLSEANRGNTKRLGKNHTEETRQKMSESHKGEKNHSHGKKWWTDGITDQLCRECPGEGWINKRLKRQK